MQFIAHYREYDEKIQTVDEHLLQTAELAGMMAEKIGMRDWGEISGLLHDIGKNTELFYKYICESANINSNGEGNTSRGSGQKIDHATAGAQVIHKNHDIPEPIRSILALIIKSHHGVGLIDCLCPDGENSFEKRMNKDDDQTRLKEALQNTGKHILENINAERIERIINQWELWQNTYRNIGRTKGYFMVGMLTRYLFSCLIDADRINTADFQIPAKAKKRKNGAYIGWEKLFVHLENRLGQLEGKNYIDEIRKSISDQCVEKAASKPGLFTLAVPTGGGKTLASLRFGIKHAKENGLSRIIFVLPYISIIEQNAEVIRTILSDDGLRENIVLEHHSNILPENTSPEMEVLSENWDCPIVVTTMVQLLNTLFSGGTTSVRRYHQLANSLIVFDEIQCLNIKMTYLFNSTMEFLMKSCGTSILFSTATQPLLEDAERLKYPLVASNRVELIGDEQKLFQQLKRVDVFWEKRLVGWSNKEIVNFVMSEKFSDKNLLIVTNTKRMAKLLAEQFKDQETNVFHLSTNMCPQHRSDTIERIKSRLIKENKIQRLICVSTSLIEAGVDLDFDVVFRFTAGLDSIAQAAGRCNRNGKLIKDGILARGEVYIIDSKEERLKGLEEIEKAAAQTRRILEEYSNEPERFDFDILGVKAMTQYYRYYFFDRENEMSYNVSLEEYGVHDTLYNLLSENTRAFQACRSGVKPSLRFSFKTAGKYFQAIEDGGRGVIVPYENRGKELINEFCSTNSFMNMSDLLKEAQIYSVNIREFYLRKLLEKGIISEVQKNSGIFYIHDENYNEIYGLTEDLRKEDLPAIFV